MLDPERGKTKTGSQVAAVVAFIAFMVFAFEYIGERRAGEHVAAKDYGLSAPPTQTTTIHTQFQTVTESPPCEPRDPKIEEYYRVTGYARKKPWCSDSVDVQLASQNTAQPVKDRCKAVAEAAPDLAAFYKDVRYKDVTNVSKECQ